MSSVPGRPAPHVSCKLLCLCAAKAVSNTYSISPAQKSTRITPRRLAQKWMRRCACLSLQHSSLRSKGRHLLLQWWRASQSASSQQETETTFTFQPATHGMATATPHVSLHNCQGDLWGFSLSLQQLSSESCQRLYSFSIDAPTAASMASHAAAVVHARFRSCTHEQFGVEGFSSEAADACVLL